MTIRSLTSNAFWMFITHLLSRGSLVVVAIILARRFPPEIFAGYSYFHLTVSMLSAYAAMGLGITSSRVFAELNGKADGQDKDMTGTLWFLSLLQASLAFCIVLMLPEMWLNAGLSIPGWLLASGVFSLIIVVVPNGAILGLELYRQGTAVAFLAAIVLIMSAFYSVEAGEIVIIFIAYVATTLLQAIGNILLIFKTLGWRRMTTGFIPRRKVIIKVLGFSGPMFLVSLLSASAVWLVGRIILSGPAGEYAFALFSIGLQWFSLCMVIPGIISRVLLPRLVQCTEPIVYRTLVHSGAAMAVIAAGLITLIGAVVGSWAATWYGTSYELSGAFFVAYLAPAIFSAPANTFGNALVIKDGQWQWLGLSILWAVVLISAAWFLREYTIFGGALSYAIAYGFMVYITYIHLRHKGLA